jgi:hypothetical protein
MMPVISPAAGADGHWKIGILGIDRVEPVRFVRAVELVDPVSMVW